MPVDTFIWLFLSALIAGVVNSLAGGGTLLTFPALLAVVSPVVANHTIPFPRCLPLWRESSASDRLRDDLRPAA